MKKIKLNSINIKSFVTVVQVSEKQTFNGGFADESKITCQSVCFGCGQTNLITLVDDVCSIEKPKSVFTTTVSVPPTCNSQGLHY